MLQPQPTFRALPGSKLQFECPINQSPANARLCENCLVPERTKIPSEFLGSLVLSPFNN